MDEETLQFYRGNAEAYAGREITSRQARLTAFLALLPPGASILELGCGAGGDTAEMLARGFDVRATDGSPEMAAVASKRLGRTVETLLFHELDEVEAYDAVWANACLLHVPRDELADILALIWRALKAERRLLRQLQGPATATGATRSTAITIIRRRTGCAPLMPRPANWSSLAIETGEVIGFDDKMGHDAVRRGQEEPLTPGWASRLAKKDAVLGVRQENHRRTCCRCDRAGHWMGHGRPSSRRGSASRR